MLKRILYDCEVFLYDWVFVFKELDTNEYHIFHNNSVELIKYVRQSNAIFGGFNNKHFDNYIVKAISVGLDYETIKEISNYLVDGYNGWQLPYFAGSIKFSSFDLRDDMMLSLSLKAIEGHLGLPIVESNIDFNIERSLTQREVDEVILYCKNDVNATEVLYNLRLDYLNTKVELGNMRKIPEETSLSCTNAGIVAKYLNAIKKPRNDGRDYVFPDTINTKYVPQQVFDFFSTIKDTSITEKELFNKKLEIKLNNVPCIIRWGGIHGSLKKYSFVSNDNEIIQNRDVRSMYPSLAIQYDYMSRNCADSTAFVDTYNARMVAKDNHDKKTAKTLKLPLNTYTGAMENQYNDLYDPIKPRSIRITGQILITELVNHLSEACESFKLINLNTDGFAYKINKKDLPTLESICSEWEKRVRLNLELDEIKEIYVKDVNNLLIIMQDGTVKTVGGYLNYGVSEKGAWSINNNYICVKKALIDYFTKKIPIEESINNNNNIFDFQIITNCGSSYKEASYTIGGERQVIQKVNRIYATNNTAYGTIKKLKFDKTSDDKIGNLPEHVLIDNDNKLSIIDIDKSWYIDKAKKMLNDFIDNSSKVKKLQDTILKLL